MIQQEKKKADTVETTRTRFFGVRDDRFLNIPTLTQERTTGRELRLDDDESPHSIGVDDPDLNPTSDRDEEKARLKEIERQAKRRLAVIEKQESDERDAQSRSEESVDTVLAGVGTSALTTSIALGLHEAIVSWPWKMFEPIKALVDGKTVWVASSATQNVSAFFGTIIDIGTGFLAGKLVRATDPLFRKSNFGKGLHTVLKIGVPLLMAGYGMYQVGKSATILIDGGVTFSALTALEGLAQVGYYAGLPLLTKVLLPLAGYFAGYGTETFQQFGTWIREKSMETLAPDLVREFILDFKHVPTWTKFKKLVRQQWNSWYD